MALVLLLALALTLSPADEKVVTESFMVGGRQRSFHLFVPEKAAKANPAPLIVMLHGSGRDGRIIVEQERAL